MSHRHSCERCRQQKVRCLRDSETMQKPSPGQSIPKCSRCAKAGTTCVYSLRLRTRRPGPNAGTGVTIVGQGLQSAADKYPTPFDSVDEDASPYQLDIDTFNWDQMTVFSPMPLGLVAEARGSVDHFGLDLDMTAGGGGLPGESQWWGGVPPSPPLSSPKPEPDDYDEAMPPEDSLQGLTSQATAVSARAVSTTRRLQRPGSAPPTVSSALVNEAFEGTKTLVRVINSVVAMAPPPPSPNVSTAHSSNSSNSSDGDEMEAAAARSASGGLVLTTLACHQHLLAFFRAICESIERFVESVADGKRPTGGPSPSSSSLHGDGPPSTAQFTMVLQLLVHLINRLDRCLFPAGPASLFSSSAASAYGGAAGLNPDLVLAGQEGDEVPDTTGIPSLAQALVRAMPADHLKLRRTISELQARMESLEAF
ncbi:hypothetical protein RB595_003940 [Gaeumannomyces hyphopodioides]